MKENFYRYQTNRVLILLVWGLANTAAGLVGAILSGVKFWRHFWLQAFAWGAIDAGIALLGIRSQRRKEAAGGEAITPAVARDIRNFHRVLLLNVFLDTGYVISGVFIRRYGVKKKSQTLGGIGAGFQFQGLYLFFFDLLLDLDLRRQWLNRLQSNRPKSRV
jgi:hypothetical protein